MRRPGSWLAALAAAAALILALAAPPAGAEGDAAKQRTFLQALAAIDAGDYPRAISLLGAMLAEEPDLHRVRLELARAYFLARQWERARREFFTVLSADIPAAVRANILAFLREIDARRGWDWGLELALIGGEGLTRHYRADRVTLLISGQKLDFDIRRPKAPDLGIAFGAHLEHRSVVAEGRNDGARVLAGLRAEATGREFPGARFDDRHLRLAASATLVYPERSLRLAPFAAHRWLGGAPFEAEFGLDAELIDRSLPPWTFSLGASAGQVVDRRGGAGGGERDGWRYTARVGAERSIGGRMIAGGSLGVARLDAAVSFESATEGEVALFLSRDLGRGLVATVRPTLRRLIFDGRAPAFPRARRDWEAAIGLQLVRYDVTVGGFSPFLAWEYAWHDSTVALHRYSDLSLRIGFAKAF